MMDKNVHDIVVIGAGIVGISTALALRVEGRDVLVVDRNDGKARASEMNAGAFAFASIVPLATPGIIHKAPKWLFDPLGPLSISPAYALKIVPWMLRFWRASRPDRYQASLAAQAGLMKLSQSALERQIKDTAGEALFRREGQFQLYEGEREFRASLDAWDQRAEHGICFELLEGAEAIADIQPGLHPRFTHAGYTPHWMNVRDPARWLAHLAKAFLALGGRIKHAEATALVPEENEIRVQTLEGNILSRQVVVCAGAWSHHLARSLSDHIPLETERGYNTTLPDGAFDLKTHLTFPGHGFAITRINDGIRIGGAVEFGGLELPPNFKRADILLKKAKAFLPDINTDKGKRWMGFRPSMPDSLPVVDRSPKDRRIIYAFGHGHLGLTQSAGTARLVVALANDTPPPFDMGAFSAHRF